MKTKRLFALLLAMLMTLSLSACGSKGDNAPADNAGSANNDITNEDDSNNDVADDDALDTEAANASVESDGYAKFCQIEMGMTESEVNAILGEPARVDKAYYYYNVVVNGKDLELEVWINTVSGIVTYKSGNFNGEDYRAEFADSATDFSAVDALESGELDTYEACAEAFKTPGYLISLDEDGVSRYLWVDSNNGYMAITFKADGTVRSYNGFC